MSEPRAKQPSVLVIDDDIQVRRLLHSCLERNGYQVMEAPTGESGIDEAIRHQPDIVLLELGLPDINGQAVLKRLREWSLAPILVVSGSNHEEDKITALDNGANDYVTKPFSTGELLARLRVARRALQPVAKVEAFRSGHLTVDIASRTVKRDGQQVRLTGTEYALLLYFVQHAGKVLTHGQILREIWQSEEAEKTGPLRVYVGYLREKIEMNPGDPQLLITEPGVGYRLVVRE